MDGGVGEGAGVFQRDDARIFGHEGVAGCADRADESDFFGAGEEDARVVCAVEMAELVERSERGGDGGEIVAGVGVEDLFAFVVGDEFLFWEVPGGDGATVDGSRGVQDGVVAFVGWLVVGVFGLRLHFFADGRENKLVGIRIGGGVDSDFGVGEVVVHDTSAELEDEFCFGEDLVDDEGGVVEVGGEVDWVVGFLVVGDSDFDVAVGVGFGGEVWSVVEPVGDPGDDAVFVTCGGGDGGELFEPVDVVVASVGWDGVEGFIGGCVVWGFWG